MTLSRCSLAPYYHFQWMSHARPSFGTALSLQVGWALSFKMDVPCKSDTLNVSESL